MEIGRKIKTLREIRNLTQSHLAQELGLTQSAYSKIELGEVELSYSKLETVAKVLGMKPEEIIAPNKPTTMIFFIFIKIKFSTKLMRHCFKVPKTSCVLVF